MDRVTAYERYGGPKRDDESTDDFLTRAGLYWHAVGVRYFGPDNGHARHDWCRANDCISCGCTQAGPCTSHSPARGYRDRFSDVSDSPTCG